MRFKSYPGVTENNSFQFIKNSLHHIWLLWDALTFFNEIFVNRLNVNTVLCNSQCIAKYTDQYVHCLCN